MAPSPKLLARDRWKYFAKGLRTVAARAPMLGTVTAALLVLAQHRYTRGHWPKVRGATTFNEKLIRKTIFDRRPYLTMTADKHAVRVYVADIVGPQHLAELFDVMDSAEALNLDALPERFVIKSTHGSGQVRIVTDKTAVDVEELRCEVRDWLSSRWQSWYRKIPPRVMVEEFLGDPSTGRPPNDFKFFVMNGRVEMVQVDVDRFSGHTKSLYDPDWNRFEVEFNYPMGPDIDRPPNLELMVAMARKLGRGTDFVRVDFYDLGDRAVFGELTHSPAGARGYFEPEEFNTWLGSRWDQPRSYRRYGRTQG